MPPLCRIFRARRLCERIVRYTRFSCAAAAEPRGGARYRGRHFRVGILSPYRARAAGSAPHSHCESQLAFRNVYLPVPHRQSRPARVDARRRIRRTKDDRHALPAVPPLPAGAAAFRSVGLRPVSLSIFAQRLRSGNRSPVSQRHTLVRLTPKSFASSACDSGGLWESRKAFSGCLTIHYRYQIGDDTSTEKL